MAGCFYGTPAHTSRRKTAFLLLGGIVQKPFKTISEQVSLLSSRGVEIDMDAESVLMRNGYYPIVNGYKDPFLDRDAMQSAGDDRYKPGTKFSDLYSLFEFDRDLREKTFHYLIRAESVTRTACSYVFSEAHQEPNSYLVQDNFASAEEYAGYGLKNYIYNMHTLHDELFKKATKSRNESITHYRENYRDIPLWILANDLTFGNVEHFFKLMKPKEQSEVCKCISRAVGKLGGKEGFFDANEARKGLDVLVKTRNLCAHDERLYCAKIGGRRNADYIQFLLYLRRYLTDEEYAELVKFIAESVGSHSRGSDVVAHVLDRMGFGRLPIA